MSLAVKNARAASQGGVGRGRNVSSGDPGLFGGLIGGIGGFLRGGPTGAISGAVSGFRGQPRAAAPRALQLPASPWHRGPMPGTGQVRAPGAIAAIQRALPGGATGMQGCPAGHRPNKTAYFLKDGSFVDVGTRCVKIRRRNPLNPRALSRAIGRIESGKRAAKRLSRISIRKKC